MRRDPLIIGAGPAGTAAAITLARAGHRPILLERATGPTDKVCGDFLSLDTIQQAQSFGVDPATLGAAAIRRVRVIEGSRVAEAVLPFAALGLSRRTLDAALLRQAEAAGAVVHAGQTVRRLTRDGDTWIIQTGITKTGTTKTGTIKTGTTRTDTTHTGPPQTQTPKAQIPSTADAVFLATGKHDLRDSPRSHSGHDAVGMKTYLALAPEPAKGLQGATELTLFPGGYAGMQFVENGQALLCIAVQRAAFQNYGGNWSALLTAIQQRSPRFAMMLAGARELLPRPLAVAGVPYGYQAPAGGLFRLGDQAAVIPSLTGDGMAIALHSGQQAAEAWLAGSDAATYQRNLTRILRPQMRLAGLLHHTALNGLAQKAAVPILRLFPALLSEAARHTRLLHSGLKPAFIRAA